MTQRDVNVPINLSERIANDRKPVAKWLVFYVWGMTAVGYVDELLVYEGDEPLKLAVEADGKLTTMWANVKTGGTLR